MEKEFPFSRCATVFPGYRGHMDICTSKSKGKNDPKVQRFHTFAKRGDACHKCYNCQRSSSITFFLFLARCFSKLGYTKTIGFQFSCLISGCFWDPHVENSKNHSLRRIMEVPEVFEGELAP